MHENSFSKTDYLFFIFGCMLLSVYNKLKTSLELFQIKDCFQVYINSVLQSLAAITTVGYSVVFVFQHLKLMFMLLIC